jgi:uncharacterized protein YebE (UPF0316 family)
MSLFFVGIVEMLIISAWTKWVVNERVFASGAISMVNVLIWYYVLNTVVHDINNMYVVLLYAAGCSVGTMLSSALSKFFRKRGIQFGIGVKEEESVEVEENPQMAFAAVAIDAE